MKKSIIKNYIYNLTYQILVLIVPLITAPYLSRILGAENIGIYSYTLSIVTYFILFANLGVASYGRREIAYVRDNKYERSKTFFEIILLRVITTAISLTTFYIVFCINGEYNTYYKILILELIANTIDISWFLQGLEEFKKTVTRNVFVKIISVICIFLFVKRPEDLYKYFIIYVFSTLIGNLSLWLYLPKYLSKIKMKELKIFKHLKPTIGIFIPEIAIQVYTVLDKTMIGNIITDKSEVGIYEQSQKIVKTALSIVTSLGTVLFPRIANSMAKDKDDEVKKYLSSLFNYVWFLGIPIMFGIMAIANKTIPWFLGSGFEKAIIVTIVGAPIIMAIGLNNVTGPQYLIPAKKQSIFTKSVIIGAIFNFIMNFLLINKFGAIGAIIASVLAETLILFIQLKDIKKEMSLKIVYENCYKYIISGIIMFIITFGVGLLLDSTITTTIVQVFIGIFVYGIMLIILKDKMVYEILTRLKNGMIKKDGK